MSRRVLAVIPAKGRSHRLRGKNMAPLAGRPLVGHTVLAALASLSLDDVCVSTDCLSVARYCESLGARVPFLRDPAHAADDVHAAVPVLDMLERLGGADVYSHCVLLLPTSPLRRSESIDRVVGMSIEHETNVLSVTPVGKSLQHLRHVHVDGRLDSVTERVLRNFQDQDVTPLYALNGSVYCAPVAQLLEHGTYHYGRPLAYRMDPIEAIDINTPEELALAEALPAMRDESNIADAGEQVAVPAAT